MSLESDDTNNSKIWDLFYTESSRYPQAALIVYDDLDLMVLVLRGTKGKKERSLDMKFNLERAPFDSKFSQVAFHKGFLEQYMYLRMQLLYAISTKKVSRLLISGHSLGGALVNILMYDLVKSRLLLHHNIYAVNFGTPRVGNEAYARWAYTTDLNLHSVQNTVDPFCSIPLPRMPRFTYPLWNNEVEYGNYRHAGTLHTFTSFRGNSLMDFHSISIYIDHLKWDSFFSFREIGVG
jgi:hypothetical protein